MGIGCEPKELDSAPLFDHGAKNPSASLGFKKQFVLKFEGKMLHFVGSRDLELGGGGLLGRPVS